MAFEVRAGKVEPFDKLGRGGIIRLESSSYNFSLDFPWDSAHDIHSNGAGRLHRKVVCLRSVQ
jgi:hypothetical protein